MVALDYIPLPTVTAVLKSKIEEVEKCIQLRSISHRHPDLKSLKLSLSNMEKMMGELELQCRQEEAALWKSEQLLKHTKKQRERLQHAVYNLPQIFKEMKPLKPSRKFDFLVACTSISGRSGDPDSAQARNLFSGLSEGEEAVNTPIVSTRCEGADSEKRNKTDVPKSRLKKRNRLDGRQKNTPPRKKRKRPSICSKIPKPALITQQEFQSIPKHLTTTRITQDFLNRALNDIYQAACTKYKLIGQKGVKKSPKIQDLLLKYKEQECKQTAGLYFVTYNELISSKHIRHDATGKAVMQVLRHFKRIRQIASKRPKFVILSTV